MSVIKINIEQLLSNQTFTFCIVSCHMPLTAFVGAYSSRMFHCIKHYWKIKCHLLLMCIYRCCHITGILLHKRWVFIDVWKVKPASPSLRYSHSSFRCTCAVVFLHISCHVTLDLHTVFALLHIKNQLSPAVSPSGNWGIPRLFNWLIEINYTLSQPSTTSPPF